MSPPPWRPRVAVLYHYFYPDDVVSARHYADLCAGLAERGWEVEAWPCNRGCRDESLAFPLHERWGDVAIRRLWRPRFRQASSRGRILNSAWMLAAWCLQALRGRQPDVLVVGTDPILSILTALVMRKLRPRIRLAHWCFDLYPEGAVAEGMLRSDGWLVRSLRPLLRRAYASCDLVADLGECMRGRLEVYGHAGRKVTLVPWALAEPTAVEPSDPTTRRELFGDSSLGLLYSGNFGRAHCFTEFLDLARRLRGESVHFSFGVRGNRVQELQAAIEPEDINVSLAGFAPEETLVKRLTAADIHLVSLRPEWTGLVVPSKFFGALAVGRPVLFAGSREAAIARWIEEHKVGWILDAASRDTVAAELDHLARRRDRLENLQRHCHQVYQRHFAKQRVLDDWDRELRAVIAPSDRRLAAPSVPLANGSGATTPADQSGETADGSPVAAAHSLAERSLRGFIWMMVQTLATRLIQFGGQVILARLLSPRDYGVIGLAYAVQAFALLFQQKGVGTVLVARQRSFDRLANPAFWYSLTTGILVMLLIALTAPVAGAAFDSPDLTGVLLVLACAVPLIFLSVVPTAGLIIDMRFGAWAVVSAASAAAAMALSILLAARGWGAYSLVLPLLVTAPVSAFVLFWVRPHPLRLRPDFGVWPSLFAVSGLILAAGFLGRAIQQGDYIVLGVWYGPEVVGLYYFAYTLAAQTALLFGNNLAVILLPALSRMQGNLQRQRAAFVRSARLLALITLPPGAFLAVAADPLVRVLFGEHWVGSVPILQVLGAGVGLRSLGLFAEGYLEAQGKFAANVISLAISCGLFFLGVCAAAPFGVVWFAAAVAAMTAAGSLIQYFFALGFTRDAARTLWDVLALPFLASVLAAALVLPVVKALPESPAPCLAALALASLTFVALPLVVVWKFDAALWQDVAGLIRKFFRRQASVTVAATLPTSISVTDGAAPLAPGRPV